MREIKFRGKRKGEPNEWVFGDLNHIDGSIYIFPRDVNEIVHSADFYEVIPETVGQYTGLKDKNGKAVWEEDVVKQEKWVGVGAYADAFGVVKYKSTGFTVECLSDWLGSNATLNGNAEVIGNIHDNPELLIP